MLVQYSKNFDSGYGASPEETRLAQIVREEVSCRFVRGAVKSRYRHYFRVTQLMRLFLKALRLPGTLVRDAANEDFSAIRGALGVISLDKAVILSSEEHNILLCIKAGAAYTRDWKQNRFFISLEFYS